MNYINGYSKPIFKIFTSGNPVPTETIEIDNKYQFINEYLEDIYIENEDYSGAVFNKYRYSIIHFNLDFSQLFTKTNALKIQQVIKAFYAGKTVHIIPHRDYSSRFFDISLVPDKRLIGLLYGGALSGGNYGFTINFRTKWPVFDPHWVDPALQSTVSAVSCEEFAP